MKELTRKEFTRALYGHSYPTIVMDMANVKQGVVKGPKVLINMGEYNRPGHVCIFESGELSIQTDCACLIQDLTYSDVLDLFEASQAPVITPGKPILFCRYNSVIKEALAPVLLETRKNWDIDRPISVESFT